AALDVALEVRDLVWPEVVVELRPPLGDQAVVPGLGGQRRSRANARIDASSGNVITAPSAPTSSIASTCRSDVRGITRSSGYCSLTRRTWSTSEPRDGCHASPSSRARRSARAELPPTQISGCGDGCGSEVASWNDQYSPSKLRSPLQSSRISRIASSA